MIFEEKYFSLYILLITDQISLPDCLYFLRHESNMCIAIICYPVSEVINFVINLKDTHKEKAPSYKTPVLTKSTNMGILVVGTSNQLFIRGS